jgi:signal transduction histidine kinase
VNDPGAQRRDGRVLFLAATARDAATTQALLLSAGIAVEICPTLDALVSELGSGAAAVLVHEEAVSRARSAPLRQLIEAQPAWSDLPVLVLTRPGADSADVDVAIRTLGNVTLLERPLRVATLLSAVRTALRARARQYQIRGYLVEQARAEESLRVADQRKDEFLATLGHELRNPLAPLLTGLELLRLARPQDPVVLRVMAVMERQVSHLVRLVDDLLEVSRITRGVIDVRREPIDLAFIVRAAVETSRPAIEALGHELAVEVPDEAITISGDAVRLTQVFANLLNNAAKYTNGGGHIALTVRRNGEEASIAVRDDGIGIPHDQLSSVFEMFTQVDRSSRRTQGGLGIGLTLVRSLVTMHGGRVEARSEGLDRGSEFIVYLPVLAHRGARAVRQASPAPFPPKRILIVDDNLDAGETLGALLTALGATVSVVQSGRAALERLAAFKPEAVILDIGMPEMDGYEVARHVRRTRDNDGILLIALTGWGQENDQRRARAAGFDHHMVKPPDIDVLRDLLSTPVSH